MAPADSELPVTVVHTESGMCITTTQFADWRAVQDAFDDYQASSGPYSVDELIDYLRVEYPGSQPFDSWAVRSVAMRRDVFSWSASSPMPAGAGLRLGTTNGDSLRLEVVGYQFPDAEEPQKRDSWYVIAGSASNKRCNWQFTWQALTCNAAPLLCGWLFELAAWLEGNSNDADAPEPPFLIEPVLQFTAADRCNGRLHLRVELNGEFLPPDTRNGRRMQSDPEVVCLRVTAEDLRTAAMDLATSICAYPTMPAPSRPTG